MHKSYIALLVLFLITCKSIPIQEKEAKQIAELESVKTEIKSSNLSPQVKEKTVKTIESSQKMISDQGQIITECQQDLEKSKPWKWYFIFENIGIVILIGLLLWKRS